MCIRDSFYAGSVGKYVMEELCRIPVEADLASELRYRNPLVDEHTLLVVVSQSGETADTIAAMKECKARGARILAIVNVVGSTIAKLADHVIYTWAGPEIAVATTKGYTTQVAVLDMLAVYLARRLGKLDDQRNKELVEAILQFPSLIQRAIDLNPNLPALAQKYHGHNDMFFIGRNVDYAASMEGSLKLKEISYLHSEAYAAGELKHGTIALIEKDRPVIALACYEALFDKMMSNIKEVKARGAQVLAVVLEGNRQIFAEADDVIFVPRTEALFNSLPEIVPLQLFATMWPEPTAVTSTNPKIWPSLSLWNKRRRRACETTRKKRRNGSNLSGRRWPMPTPTAFCLATAGARTPPWWVSCAKWPVRTPRASFCPAAPSGILPLTRTTGWRWPSSSASKPG